LFEILTTLGRTLGFSFAAGINLYATVAILGIAKRYGWVALPDQFAVFDNDLVIGVAIVLYIIEFVADKIPWVDSMWDAVHTFIRIPAGAALAAAVFGWDHTQVALIAALAGGTLAATAHSAKASTRAMVNTSPEPLSNLALSLAGDAMVPGLLWLSWEHPVAFFVALAIGLVLMAVVIVLMARFVRALWQRGFKKGPPRVA